MKQEILNELIEQNYSLISENITNFLKNHLANNDSNGFIFGLSGGIDSAVLAYLCTKKFQKKYSCTDHARYQNFTKK